MNHSDQNSITQPERIDFGEIRSAGDLARWFRGAFGMSVTDPAARAEIVDLAAELDLDTDDVIRGAAIVERDTDDEEEEEEERPLTDVEEAQLDATAAYLAGIYADRPDLVPYGRRCAEARRIGAPVDVLERRFELELFKATALPGDPRDVLGAPYHREIAPGAWPAGDGGLDEFDLLDHLVGGEQIAVAWPERVSAIEFDLDTKREDQRATITDRVNAIRSLFTIGVLWRTRPGGGLRYRVALSESVDRDALRRCVLARLEAAGLVVGDAAGLEVWPNGKRDLRAPCAPGSTIVLDDGREVECSVLAWARAIGASRRMVADVLPELLEQKARARRTPWFDTTKLGGRILATAAAGAYTSRAALVRAVGGRRKDVEAEISTLLKSGKLVKRIASGVQPDHQETASRSGCTRPRRTVFAAKSGSGFVYADPAVTQPDLRSAADRCAAIFTEEKNKRVEGTPSRASSSSAKAGCTREAVSGDSPEWGREALEALEQEGCPEGERNDRAYRLAFKFVSEGLDADAAAERFTRWLGRDDHASRDLAGDNAQSVREAMLRELPAAMARLRARGVTRWTSAAGRDVNPAAHEHPLAPLSTGPRWRSEMREELTDASRGALAAALAREGVQARPADVARLEVVLASVRRASRRGAAGVAVCAAFARRVAGGRKIDNMSGSRWLVRAAQKVGILGPLISGADSNRGAARVFEIGPLGHVPDGACEKRFFIEKTPCTSAIDS